MHTVSVAEAKSHLSEILKYVVAGEEVIITRRGQPIARIEAIKKITKPLPDLKIFRKSIPMVKTSSVDLIRTLRDEEY